MRPFLTLTGALLVALVALMWWQGYFVGGPTDAQALRMCQRYAAEWYRLPATSRHSGYGAATISRAGDTFTVAGWSDTPQQRYRWTCQTRLVGGDRWELIAIG